MAKQPRSLAGQVIAITGGARGIGRATAAALVREGAKVSIGDLDLQLAREAAEQLGGGTLAFELNVTDRASFARFLEQTEQGLGPVDVLVNNAGIMPIGPFVDETDETAHRQVDINIHGVLHGMKLAIPGMTRRHHGHIVNLASAAGKAGIPGGATYCATKHAVVGVSEAVRAELRGTGVSLHLVMPAVVNTDLGSGLTQSKAVKIVEPEDVAAAIVDALAHDRFDVYVPRSLGPINRSMLLLPRGAREWVGRALKTDRVLSKPDPQRRAAYEARAARPDGSVRAAPGAQASAPAAPGGGAAEERVPTAG